MRISLTGHSQQGMIKRRRGRILHAWEVSELTFKCRKKHCKTEGLEPCLLPNCPKMWMGLISGAFAPDLFPTSWPACVVGLCEEEGHPFPLTVESECDSHLHAGIQMPVSSLDESGNPPSSSVHKLKKC